MDWIEQFFHVSPDGGNGALEALYLQSRSSRLWGWPSAVVSAIGSAVVDANPEAVVQPQS